jgi:hypothetical protein
MNQPDVVLFEKIAFFTSSQSTGMSTCNDCKFMESISRGLSPAFLKIWHVITCLVVSMQQQQWHVAPNIPNDISHVLQGASRSCLN